MSEDVFAMMDKDKLYRYGCPKHIVVGNMRNCPDCQAMPLLTLSEHAAIAEAGCADRMAHLERVRARMKAMKLSGSHLASCLYRSPSFINSCLRGNYPGYGMAYVPVYLERELRGRGIWED
ncbi:MAG TPA: hypothetical protein VN519_06420 [Bryobacteraceae bacterium]|nr:hypothetical protein [Bryobacteraceae bacterium]